MELEERATRDKENELRPVFQSQIITTTKLIPVFCINHALYMLYGRFVRRVVCAELLSIGTLQSRLAHRLGIIALLLILR